MTGPAQNNNDDPPVDSAADDALETTTMSFTAAGADAGSRLDAFLAGKIGAWSRSRLQRLVEQGDVLVNEKPAKASYKLREGDEVDVELAEVPVREFAAEDIPLDIVFEDDHLAVVNKPAGMVVHPGAGVQSGTLANAIAWRFSSAPTAAVAGSDRIGIVHRLDKNTSGLIVVAKDERTHEQLSEQFHDREVFKSYVALVHGATRDNRGSIDRPIARDRWHRTRMTVAANGRNALSLWMVRERFEKFTLLDVTIKTGRTHQIRVHLASINHPVVGDETYNEGRDNTVSDIKIRNAIRSMDRLFLHAEKLSFVHPVTKEKAAFEQPLPSDLEGLLGLIRG